MDPITKALHETWKHIISERYISPDEYIKPKPRPGGLIDLIKPKPTPGGRVPQEVIDYIKPKPRPGGGIPGILPDIDPGWRPGPRPIYPEP
jgi:hypothetical protein